MSKDIIIGIDLAKNVFQLHGARRDGQVLFRKMLNRQQFRAFCERHPNCLMAMEACSTSHYWARELQKMGHDVRLMPRRSQKLHCAQACPLVAPKSADQQALAMMMRTREQLLEQRTATVNALRGHLAEFGIIAPVGIKNVDRLRQTLADGEDIPALVCEMADQHFKRIDRLSEDIAELTAKVELHCRKSETATRLQTMPGIGPIAAMFIEALAPDMAHFDKGRDFAAWLGLVPKQYSTGGKTILGQTRKIGQRDIRRVLITGAMSCIAAATYRGKRCHPWLQDKLDRKPKMVAAIALANKMARQIWAMITKEERYQPPAIRPHRKVCS